MILPATRRYDAVESRDAGARPGTAYAFLHDRVQQSAYALIPAEQRQMVHLTVGRLLHSRGDAEQADEGIFDLVHHLNLGRALIEDPGERLALVRLNLSAGQKAKSATAHEAALEYLTAGLELVADDLWSSDYDLAFAVHLEAAEGQYRCGNFAEAEQQFSVLLQRAATNLDRAQGAPPAQHPVREHVTLRRRTGNRPRMPRALRRVLPRFGRERQAALDGEIVSIQSLLGPRSIASLVDLPVMTDPEIRMVMSVLIDIWSSAYILGEPVLARLISATMVRLSLVHGNVEESAYGYVTHAITVGPVREDYRVGLRIRQSGLTGERTLQRPQAPGQDPSAVSCPCESLAAADGDVHPHAREACRSGLESGDFLYAAYGAATEAWPAMVSTQDLAQFVREYSRIWI